MTTREGGKLFGLCPLLRCQQGVNAAMHLGPGHVQLHLCLGLPGCDTPECGFIKDLFFLRCPKLLSRFDKLLHQHRDVFILFHQN